MIVRCCGRSAPPRVSSANQVATARSYSHVCANARAASSRRWARVVPPRAHRVDDRGVGLGRDDDRDVREVLRRGAHHRGAADVDLLDDVVALGARGAPSRRRGRGSRRRARTARCPARRAGARGPRGAGRRAARRARPGGASSRGRRATRGSRSRSRRPSPRSPASRIVDAVEPVETISTPAPASASARSSRSVLSLTETSARRTGTTSRSRYRAGSWLGPAMMAPRWWGESGVGMSGRGRRRSTRDGGRGEIELAGGDAADDVDEQSALDGLDALVQAVLVVAAEHGDALLREDRPGVDAVVDDDDARAGLGDAGGERVAHAVGAGELGEVRGVGVDDARRPLLDERGRAAAA